MPDFGIGETIAAALASAGVGAETAGAIAPILAGVGEGALGGGALSGLTGGNIGKGALGGAITGGFIPAGGELLGSSLGPVAADAIGGAAGGALGGVATGGNPLTSAVEGGLSGGIAGALAPSGAPAGTPSAGSPGGPVGGGPSAPVSITPDAASTGTLVDTSQGLPWQTGTQPADVAAQVNNTGNLSTAGSAVSSSNLPGSSSIGSDFSKGLGNSPSLNTGGIDSLASASSAASAAPVAAPSSIDNFLSKPGIGSAFDVIKANPGAAISAAGLGLDAIKGNKQTGAEKNLEAQASAEGQQGAALEGYLQSGTLPPGLQASLNQASESAKASIRSRFASMGLSGSSAEQQELAAVDQQSQAQSAQMAEQLLTTGISESGMSSQLYQELLKNNVANDSNLSSAITNFASAAAGGGGLNSKGGINIQLPSGATAGG